MCQKISYLNDREGSHVYVDAKMQENLNVILVIKGGNLRPGVTLHCLITDISQIIIKTAKIQ